MVEFTEKLEPTHLHPLHGDPQLNGKRALLDAFFSLAGRAGFE
jgi:hypothetical protein